MFVLFFHLRHIKLKDSSGVVIFLNCDLSNLHPWPPDSGLACPALISHQLHTGDVHQKRLSQFWNIIL